MFSKGWSVNEASVAAPLGTGWKAVLEQQHQLQQQQCHIVNGVASWQSAPGTGLAAWWVEAAQKGIAHPDVSTAADANGIDAAASTDGVANVASANNAAVADGTAAANNEDSGIADAAADGASATAAADAAGKGLVDVQDLERSNFTSSASTLPAETSSASIDVAPAVSPVDTKRSVDQDEQGTNNVASETSMSNGKAADDLCSQFAAATVSGKLDDVIQESRDAASKSQWRQSQLPKRKNCKLTLLK